jgi:hypothetical protein
MCLVDAVLSTVIATALACEHYETELLIAACAAIPFERGNWSGHSNCGCTNKHSDEYTCLSGENSQFLAYKPPKSLYYTYKQVCMSTSFKVLQSFHG